MSFIYIVCIKNFKILRGMGIGDWGLGIGDWAQSPIPIPNPPSPIPHPHFDFISIISDLNMTIFLY